VKKKSHAPTISDVAKRAGVSAPAVSRVLSADKNFVVRDETRQRIIDAARDLNYQPSQMARGLRVSRTFSLGIVTPELDNPVHARIIYGAERAAADHGYSLLIAHRGPDMDEASIYERLVRHNRVDGLIVATLQNEQTGVPALKKLDHPFVLVNRKAKGVPHYVVIDDEGGSKKAVEHLVALGHRRIAHLAGESHRYNAKCRLRGYKAGLKEAGLAYEAGLVVESGYTQNGGAAAMRKLLDSGIKQPTAIFAATLLAAAGAMSVLREEAIRVPEDISIVGFNDGSIADVLAPPLTTVRTPIDEMGYQATSALIKHIEGDEEFVGTTLPSTEIVVRASTASISPP
jgi:LacI family transcriptional regulator